MRNLLYILALILPSCVTIEAPDHLVSDTVNVGKEAYHAVANAITGEDNQYTYIYTVPEGESLGKASEQCVSFALEKARKDLNVYNLSVENSTISTSFQGDKSLLECQIAIASQDSASKEGDE